MAMHCSFVKSLHDDYDVMISEVKTLWGSSTFLWYDPV